MDQQAFNHEYFLQNVYMIDYDDGILSIQFKDSSVIEYNIDSTKFKAFSHPWLTKNITTTGLISAGVRIDQ